ncbi:MAG TPA: PD-(D/E)XK nuclease family protein, partial [Methanospirillum sp.]|nr:PD-(D/E)XK nuclease family protein [Methanospirillum sp.]
MLTVTVSDLHLCQHCPRLFAYAKLKRRKIPPFIGHLGTGKLPGRLFHTFAHTVQNDICARGIIQADIFLKFNQEKEAFSSVFHRFVKEQYLIPFLEEYANTLPYERIEAFASACEQWIGYLNDFITPNLSEIPDWLTLLQKIVHSSEYLMKSPYSFPDAEMMQISGRPDAILFDPKTKEAVVVEYKARKESDPLQDLAQTSLYSWLVHTSIGILPRVDILYLEEKQPLVRYFVPAIQDIIENHPSLFQLARDILHGKRPVPQCTSPALCQICPYAHTCDGDFGIPVEKTSISPKPVPGNTETHDTPPAPDELLSMLTEKLRLLSIPVIPAGYTVGPRFIRLKIIPDIKKRVTFSKIVNRTVDIQLGLALSSPPL